MILIVRYNTLWQKNDTNKMIVLRWSSYSTICDMYDTMQYDTIQLELFNMFSLNFNRLFGLIWISDSFANFMGYNCAYILRFFSLDVTSFFFTLSYSYLITWAQSTIFAYHIQAELFILFQYVSIHGFNMSRFWYISAVLY